MMRIWPIVLRHRWFLVLREGDQRELIRLIRASSGRAGLALRARIVLLAADGLSNTAIAEKVGVTRPTVIGWRARYSDQGVAGLTDIPRAGRPRVIDHSQIVAATLKPPPKKLGVTHWSSRLLGDHLGISNGTVATTWRACGIQPWRLETFITGGNNRAHHFTWTKTAAAILAKANRQHTSNTAH